MATITTCALLPCSHNQASNSESVEIGIESEVSMGDESFVGAGEGRPYRGRFSLTREAPSRMIWRPSRCTET
jgi:hypothetical protein